MTGSSRDCLLDRRTGDGKATTSWMLGPMHATEGCQLLVGCACLAAQQLFHCAGLLIGT